MPSFVCRTCGAEIEYGIGDSEDLAEQAVASKLPFPMVMTNTMTFSQWLYNQTRGECERCYSVISRQSYPRNIKLPGGQKAVTIFSSMGQSLGDRVMQQVIKDRYVADNPDEKVIFLTEMPSLAELRGYRPLKLFWANLFTGGQEFVLRDAYWFAVTNEASELQRQGHYARLWFPVSSQQSVEKFHEISVRQSAVSSQQSVGEWKRYVVVHLRNQIGVADKDEKKNINPVYAFLIFKLLQNRHKAGMIDGAVIVGNDSAANGYDIETIERFIDDSLPIVDLRNRFSRQSAVGSQQSAVTSQQSAVGSLQSAVDNGQSGDAGLKEIAWICKNAVMTIGRDSGIIQLAGAAGCPKLVSWDYVTEGWFPKVKSGVLSAWVVKDSSVEKVLEAIKLGIG